MRVELTDEFDRNFERKGFFSDKWKPRAHDYPKGSLLMVSGAMRRSTRGEVSGNGVRFTSAKPYTGLHNEEAAKGKQHIVDNRLTYGHQNSAEFIAEAWSEYLNNETPRPIAIAVGTLIKKWLSNKSFFYDFTPARSVSDRGNSRFF